MFWSFGYLYLTSGKALCVLDENDGAIARIYDAIDLDERGLEDRANLMARAPLLLEALKIAYGLLCAESHRVDNDETLAHLKSLIKQTEDWRAR